MNNELSIEGSNIPPIGKLFNPFTGFWQNAAYSDFVLDSFPNQEISEEVKVIYDERLVPHIFAQNDLDLSYAQGYVTAKHRLWQMDMIARLSAGRLSEVIGEKMLEKDKEQRRKGMVWAAENTIRAWSQSKEEYPKLQAFVKGINAYINSLEPKDYPIEFKLLDYAPEEWTELKTALLSKNMAATLCMREQDREASNALAVFGRETFDFLYPDYNPKQSPIIPEEVKWDFKNPLNTAISMPQNDLSLVPRRSYPVPPEGIGSNNWAVSGKKTASGYPILCNDPHLPLTLPSTWFEIQLQTPTQNVYGVSLPGMPGIMIGFNENISWGLTNVGHDVLDWYRINWAEANKSTYFLDNKIKEVDKVIETIKVKGKGVIYDTVKYTVWGPIVEETKNNNSQDLAMRWLAHMEPDINELSTFSKLNKAKNYDDFYNALQHYNAPAQNIAFASRDGDIALKVQGLFPLKRKEQGRFVQDGSQSANGWTKFIPKEHNPSVKNPNQGFVASANQRSTSPDYPYYYNGGFEDYRGRILNRILSKMDNISPEDMMALQNNNFSIKAEDALPLMIKYVDLTDLDETDEAYLDQLKEWNYKYTAEAICPILFEEWFKAFNKNTWDEVYTLAKKMDILFPESWRTIALLEDHPDNIFFDKKNTKKIEQAKDIVHQSFKEMSNTVQNLEIDNNGNLEWYKYRNATVNHLLNIPAFSRANIKSGGCANALNAIRGGQTALKGWAPSWRMVVAFGEETIEAYGIYPGGQSGNPASKYYDNMINDWTEGKYYKLHFLKTPEDLGEHTLFVQIWRP